MNREFMSLAILHHMVAFTPCRVITLEGRMRVCAAKHVRHAVGMIQQELRSSAPDVRIVSSCIDAAVEAFAAGRAPAGRRIWS